MGKFCVPLINCMVVAGCLVVTAKDAVTNEIFSAGFTTDQLRAKNLQIGYFEFC